MRSAASFTEILEFGFKTTVTWAFGSNFNTKFRLVGPWKWDGANEIMRTELWDVVKQSGGWVCRLYSVIEMLESTPTYKQTSQFTASFRSLYSGLQAWFSGSLSQCSILSSSSASLSKRINRVRKIQKENIPKL
jgi:hypothetical protein